MEQEIWKVIKDYPCYSVSNFGRVKSFKWGKEKILKPSASNHGYLCVRLESNKVVKGLKVHKLVMEAFVDNPLNKHDVNHKDGIKSNNNLHNLEWNTRSENLYHAYRVLNRRPPGEGRIGILNSCSLKVNQLSLTGELIKTWDCISDAKRQIGVDPSCVRRACIGKIKTAKGFKWEYIK